MREIVISNFRILSIWGAVGHAGIIHASLFLHTLYSVNTLPLGQGLVFHQCLNLHWIVNNPTKGSDVIFWALVVWQIFVVPKNFEQMHLISLSVIGCKNVEAYIILPTTLYISWQSSLFCKDVGLFISFVLSCGAIIFPSSLHMHQLPGILWSTYLRW